jgi:hypothetical protein
MHGQGRALCPLHQHHTTNGSYHLTPPPRRRQLILQLADQQKPEPQPEEHIGTDPSSASEWSFDFRLSLDPQQQTEAMAPPTCHRARPGRWRVQPQGAGARVVALVGLLPEHGSLRGHEQAAPATPAGVSVT